MKRLFATIYILLVTTLFVIPFGIGPIIETLFEEEVAEAERELSKGTFYLIAEKLAGLDREDQARILGHLQPNFGYPLGLYSLDEIQVADEDELDFLGGVIISDDERDMLVLRLGNSKRALTMGGPFPGQDLEFKATILFWGLFILFLTVPALAWTYFMYRDVKKIEGTTGRFATGEHDARVSISRVSPMTQIATAFNTMAEKTQKLLASQKDLANSVSHEIRTPLARIKFSLEMLVDKIMRKPGETDYISEIGRDVEEIETLVDEMLTYAKFERETASSGRLPNHELISWLDNLISTEQKTVSRKRLRFSTVPATRKFIARFEPVYLGWAVRNLVRNGICHAGSRVDVIFEQRPEHYCIHVDDDGPGIPESARSKIFQPFFRLDESRSRKSGGYGLGLAIAKRIAEWHNGRIWVGVSPASGARFTITLPSDADISRGE